MMLKVKHLGTYGHMWNNSSSLWDILSRMFLGLSALALLIYSFKRRAPDGFAYRTFMNDSREGSFNDG